MNQGKFLGLTAAGSLIWNSIFVLSGFYLGENWHVVEAYAGVFQKIVIVVVVLLVVLWMVLKIRKARAQEVPPRCRNPDARSSHVGEPEPWARSHVYAGTSHHATPWTGGRAFCCPETHGPVASTWFPWERAAGNRQLPVDSGMPRS